MIERAIATGTHGRFLVTPPAASAPAPLLVGFHGYGEDAAVQLDRLCLIPESDHWLRISVQGLNRFYAPRSEKVVASWMTRQDRELAITDNIAYVERCIEAVRSEWPSLPTIVFAGFSQGTSMAFRAAANTSGAVTAVIASGGDIPPELSGPLLKRIPAALITRGHSDPWYTEEKLVADEQRLRESDVDVEVLRFDGGHEWSTEVNIATSAFLRKCQSA